MPAPYYADDKVTLYLGDCREVTDWLAADVLVTDPPYGVLWREGALNDKAAVRAASTQSIAGDEDSSVRDAALALWGRPRPMVVFGTWRVPRPRQTRHRLIWHKAGRQPGITTAPIFPNDEEVYLIGDGWQGGPMPTVITTHEQRGKQPALVGHPTPKPLDLMERLIQKCPPGIIADPFAGSGSTLVAARNLGRKAVGVELDERYCEVIAKRLAQDCLDLGDPAA